MKTPHPAAPVPAPSSPDPTLPQAAKAKKVIHLVPAGDLLDGLDGLPTPPPMPYQLDEPSTDEP